MKKDTHTSIGSVILGVVIIGGLLWELSIVNALWGFWAAALALILFPGTLALIPWYMLLVYGNWQLLIFIYGGFILGVVVHCFGDNGSDEHTENLKSVCDMEIHASANQTNSAAVSDDTNAIEIGPRDAKASDNSGIANMKIQRILVIDDNPHIHKDWKQLLEGVNVNSATEKELAIFGASSDYAGSEGFEIDSAFQGQEGLDKIRQALQEEHPYVMAIVDIRMPPGWDGVKTIEHIWKICPDLHIVICAAYSDYTWPEIVERLGRSEKLVMLKHPFNNIEVQQFAVGLAEKVGCKLSARIEKSLKRMAESMRPGVRCC